MGLQTYHRKRDFRSTLEPKGTVSRVDAHRFVVHEHHASRLHYDFRLEMGGVLKSWAIPKGPSLNPRHKRLAVRVEDHPVDYINFEGHIKEGNYGAGDVFIWDEGTYELSTGQEPANVIEQGKLSFRLYGGKLYGLFNLVRMGKQHEQWLLIKADDEFADPAWVLQPCAAPEVPTSTSQADSTSAKLRGESVLSLEMQRAYASSDRSSEGTAAQRLDVSAIAGARRTPMPTAIEPMRATLVNKAFSNPEWLYETKWDGIRALCFIENGQARLVSRQEKEMGFRYPELLGIAHNIRAEQAILDGEIITLNEKGLPSFQLLQARIGLEDSEDIQRLACLHPAIYYVFDIIYYNGFNLMACPLLDRKTLLKASVVENDTVRYSEHIFEHGEQFFHDAERLGIEGVIAKHKDSPYLQKRSNTWLKFKTQKRQEVVIAGYTEPRGTRPLFGALVVGLYTERGEFHCAGHVGGGFNYQSLEHVYGLMQGLKTDTSPFNGLPHTNEPVQWLIPKLVCEVKFTEWTADKRMRHPIFMGIRDDKDPRQCIYEIEYDSHTEMVQAKGVVYPPARRARQGSVAVEDVFRSRHLHGDIEIIVEGHILRLTHLDRLYWPEKGCTKGDLLRYYYKMAPVILPYLKDRPLILKRYPNGIHETPFYQHDLDDPPEFLATIRLESEAGRKLDYGLCNNLASLLYFANLGVVAQHPWHSRQDSLDRPDWVVFDLDPGDLEFDVTRRAAMNVNHFLDKLGLESYCKTSGSRGMHVYVPIEPIYSYAETASFAESVSRLLQRDNPEIFTLERSLKKRPQASIYLDHLQNARGKSIVSPYSPREQVEASVSTPLEWKEVKRKLSPKNYTIGNMRQRVIKKGDLFTPVLTHKQKLTLAIDKLEKQWKVMQ